MPISKYPKYLEMGSVWGKLTIVGIDGCSMWKKDGKRQKPSDWKYWCQCNCIEKKVTSIRKQHIVNGRVKSCGCLCKDNIEKMVKARRKVNPIEICGDITKIFFFNVEGEYTIIDTEDYSKIKDYCWSKTTKGKPFYARTGTHKQKNGNLLLHQILCPCEKGWVPDHKNGDGLDNRKSNLRPATTSQNNMNSCLQSNNTSGCAGVTYDSRFGVWYAKINVNKKYIYLGSFTEFGNAVKARKEAEIKYFGEFSYHNSRGVKEK